MELWKVGGRKRYCHQSSQNAQLYPLWTLTECFRSLLFGFTLSLKTVTFQLRVLFVYLQVLFLMSVMLSFSLASLPKKSLNTSLQSGILRTPEVPMAIPLFSKQRHNFHPCIISFLFSLNIPFCHNDFDFEEGNIFLLTSSWT